MPALHTEMRVADASASRLPNCCGLAALSLALLLAACASPKHRAPVEERPMGASAKPAGAAPNSTATTTADARPLPGAENAGKPGYYTVKPGDTLIRVALDNGQTWRDLVKWNGLANPNLIEVGQVLRVIPPGADAGVSTRPVGVARVEARPLDSKPLPAASPAASGSQPAAAAGTASAAASGNGAASSVSAASAATKSDEDDIVWTWPVAGAVLQGFDEQRNKGLDFGGRTGDPVYASANGRVVYVGSGIRGYGNIIILKHGTDYLSVYAHNQAMLVKEEQVVLKGQKIAEMGSSDADQVKLHFEVRKSGKTLDPAKVLPPR